MNTAALEHAEYWLSNLNTAKLVAAFLVAIGVAVEFGADWIARPYEKIVKDAKDLQLKSFENETAEAKLETERLRSQLSARTLTKEQFDVLQKLKGKVRSVAIASDSDAEPSWFAGLIAVALQKAGIKVTVITRGAGVHSSANFLVDNLAFSNPNGKPTNGEPLISIFKEAGIPMNGGIAAVRPRDLSSIPPEVPIIVIGGRFTLPPKDPYLGHAIAGEKQAQ